MRETATKRKSHIATAWTNVIKFCEILDTLPIGFRFKLNNLSKDFNGFWKKTVSNGITSWKNGPTILYSSSFFLRRKEVLEAIERTGRQVRKLYFSEKKPKISSLLTKTKVKDLYYKQKKSLQEIAKEYGCSKQWVFLLMEKYRLKRRTHSEARKEVVKQNKATLIRPKR